MKGNLFKFIFKKQLSLLLKVEVIWQASDSPPMTTRPGLQPPNLTLLLSCTELFR